MKFSILLPTRNRLELLKLAIQSITNQPYKDWEIIVSDNYSEENIDGFITSLKDSRIKYYGTERFITVTENWNNALQQATGDYHIMLGDDDALLPCCLESLAENIESFAQPEAIYFDAFQYAYANVIPGKSHAFIQRGYSDFFSDTEKSPFLLKQDTRLSLIHHSLNFRLKFGFNMQHYAVHKSLVEKLKKRGDFYQSPYPDYYAANVLLLSAKRMLAVPKPLIVIGISPKSFGFYYFNDEQTKGHEFLNNQPSDDIGYKLTNALLPGSELNSNWLYAMETLKTRFPEVSNLEVGYQRYRYLQLYALYFSGGFRNIWNIRDQISYNELVLSGLIALAATPLNLLKKKFRAKLLNEFYKLYSPYPLFDTQQKTVSYKDIIEFVKSDENDCLKPSQG
jgi:glycosyltransferase involved in cell wall biosynthesis